MAASETEDSDLLWCINHDSFPFKKPLMEAQVGFFSCCFFIIQQAIMPFKHLMPACYCNESVCLYSFADDLKYRWTHMDPLCHRRH